MCRASSRQQQHQQHHRSSDNKMAPQNDRNDVSYGNRLDRLKQVLKPYRDNNANCLRSITRSARVNLNKHWKSLENLFAATHDNGHRGGGGKERAQNVANERRENGENARPPVAFLHNPTADAVEKLRHLYV